MLPFITVALVPDSFAIGKYPYKPAMSFMREQIPKSLSFAWFCLGDLHPCPLEEAIMTLARNIGTDGRSTASGSLVYCDHGEGRRFFKKNVMTPSDQPFSR